MLRSFSVNTLRIIFFCILSINDNLSFVLSSLLIVLLISILLSVLLNPRMPFPSNILLPIDVLKTMMLFLKDILSSLLSISSPFSSICSIMLITELCAYSIFSNMMNALGLYFSLFIKIPPSV